MMTDEMMELIILNRFIEVGFDGRVYNANAIFGRKYELERKFFSKYVLVKDSKEK